MTKRDLIDLAVEYGMIKSTLDFASRSQKAQDAIIRTIRPVAVELGLVSDDRTMWGVTVGSN